MSSNLKKFDPAVDKRFLIALSGIIWSIIGLLLCNLAVKWLSEISDEGVYLFGITGMVTAFLIYYFGFLKLVNTNINRILSKDGKVCVFGFQPWRSYLIIIIMIGLGSILRQSVLPKPYLSIIYIGFGGAMILSSFRYYKVFFKTINKSY